MASRPLLLLTLAQVLAAPVVRAQFPEPDTSSIPLPFKGFPRIACTFAFADSGGPVRTPITILNATWQLPAMMVLHDQSTRFSPVANASLTYQRLASSDSSFSLTLERGSLSLLTDGIGLFYPHETTDCFSGECRKSFLIGCDHCLDIEHRCEQIVQGRRLLIAWAGREWISEYMPSYYAAYAAFDLGNDEWFTMQGWGSTPQSGEQVLTLIQSVRF